MAYITREDGERFVIPSYRDVITAKQKSVVKKEILLLSQSYGEYITLQKKSATQYEVAFSNETGYLLGETVWQHFKRPADMIFCEAIPNTNEAILVIVKAGSVYLDGSFPLESIPEELIIFLTQQNNFEIYIYGDVPISQNPEAGKFSFEANSVKSFTVLDKPAFPVLPLLKIYQLQLVDAVLKEHGIGVTPIKPIAIAVAVIVGGYFLWSYVTTPTEEEVKPIEVAQVNPWQQYNDALSTPSPDEEVKVFLDTYNLFATIPGWTIQAVRYAKGNFTADVISNNATVASLFNWAKNNGGSVIITANGFSVSKNVTLNKRHIPKLIFPINEIIATIIDLNHDINPGNNLQIGTIATKGNYKSVMIGVALTDSSPMLVAMFGENLKNLPINLQSITMSLDLNTFNSSITFEVLGS